MQMPTVTIVVPVYNEQDNIEHFVCAVKQAMQQQPYRYEILFVDDGSKDQSRSILHRLLQNDAHVKALFLAKNYGHQLALTCGLDHAAGDAVITMDGDMQHPPAMIPQLLALWQDGWQVVQTIRDTTEGVSAFKRLTSKYYYKFLNRVSEVPIQPGGSDFRLLDRAVVLAFRKYREQHRFIRGLIGNIGFRQTQVHFTAPPRYAGKSKFSLRKMANFALDGVIGNTTLPLHLAMYLGILSIFVSGGLLLHVLYVYTADSAVPGWATLMICLLFFGGTQLLILGILGEYIGRIFEQVKGRPLYQLQPDPFNEAAATSSQKGSAHDEKTPS